jgi:hypothetical protein
LQSLFMDFDTQRFHPSTFSHHGRLLTTFHVRIPDSVRALQELRRHCPQIQNLRYTMRRECGNEYEVMRYQELGAFPKLADLEIYMRVGRHGQMRRGADSDDIKVYRYYLAKSAIDYRLASEIFNQILRANRAVRPDVMPSFERLSIFPQVTDDDRAFALLQSSIARRWLYERMYADLSSEAGGGFELDKQIREAFRDELESFWVTNGQNERRVAVLIREAWKQNWPVDNFSDAAWLDGWKSYSLWPYEDGPTAPRLPELPLMADIFSL